MSAEEDDKAGPKPRNSLDDEDNFYHRRQGNGSMLPAQETYYIPDDIKQGMLVKVSFNYRMLEEVDIQGHPTGRRGPKKNINGQVVLVARVDGFRRHLDILYGDGIYRLGASKDLYVHEALSDDDDEYGRAQGCHTATLHHKTPNPIKLTGEPLRWVTSDPKGIW